MLNVRLDGDHLNGSLGMSVVVSFYDVLFPKGCLRRDLGLN